MMDLMIHEEKLRLRRQLLTNVIEMKTAIDDLLNKGFFRALLRFYEQIEGAGGVAEWMSLYRDADGDIEECEDCVSGKLRLYEKLIFELNESKIIELTGELLKTRESYVCID